MADAGPPHKKPKMIAPQQKVVLMETPDQRTSANGTKYGACTVLCTTTQYNQLHEMFCTEKHIQKLSQCEKKAIFIKGYTQRQDGTISINDATKIMDTTHNLNMDHIRKFQCPSIEEVAVIKTKQRNDRVSVRGKIEKTSAVIETASSKRKIVTLEDNSGQIEIKLWGNKIDLIKDQGTTVSLKGLRVDIYNGRYSLNSTPSTTIEINDANQEISGEVEAACFDE
ncbi:uncharacterized protein [Magallana gigas]|uniref:uncharacterized protein n=1 Tax=Magallana gigas TaxID=29159 RepID=UPI00333F4C27